MAIMEIANKHSGVLFLFLWFTGGVSASHAHRRTTVL